MPRRLPDKTKNAPRKPRRFGSQSRYRPSRPFLQTRPVKENQEIEVVIDDIGSRGDGIARIEGYLIFVPGCKIGERIKVKIRSVSEKFALAERVTWAEKMSVKIKELRDGMKRVNVKATVTEKSDPREVMSRFKDQTYRVATAIVTDETGTVKLTLWNDQIEMVNVNDTVRIENGYVTSFRGEIQLNVGKFGTLTVE
jgi:replication factor A1